MKSLEKRSQRIKLKKRGEAGIYIKNSIIKPGLADTCFANKIQNIP